MPTILRALLLALALLPFGLRPASAQVGELIAELIDNCRIDAREFCADVEPGGGRIAACLYARMDDLTPRCYRAMRDGIALRACGRDYHRFCRDVPLGEGRLASCLRDYREDVSPGCLDALAFSAPRAHRFGRYDHSPKYAEPYTRKPQYIPDPEGDDGVDELK